MPRTMAPTEFEEMDDLDAFYRKLEEGNEAEWQIRTCEKLGGDLRALELEIAKKTLDQEHPGVIEQGIWEMSNETRKS